MCLTFKKFTFIYHFAKDNNVYFEFHPSFFCIKDLFSSATLLSGKSHNGLYPLQSLSKIHKSHVAYLGERTTLDHWHSRLGWPALRIVKHVISNYNLVVMQNKSNLVCHACQLGKSHRLPFHLSPLVSNAPLDLLFTDVWGLDPQIFVNGNRYYLCFIDDFSKYVWLFPIASNLMSIICSLNFKPMLNVILTEKSNVFNQIGAVNFVSFIPSFTSLRISHCVTCPHTH
jgi:hypothetical protein